MWIRKYLGLKSVKKQDVEEGDVEKEGGTHHQSSPSYKSATSLSSAIENDLTLRAPELPFHTDDDVPSVHTDCDSDYESSSDERPLSRRSVSVLEIGSTPSAVARSSAGRTDVLDLNIGTARRVDGISFSLSPFSNQSVQQLTAAIGRACAIGESFNANQHNVELHTGGQGHHANHMSSPAGTTSTAAAPAHGWFTNLLLQCYQDFHRVVLKAIGIIIGEFIVTYIIIRYLDPRHCH